MYSYLFDQEEANRLHGRSMYRQGLKEGFKEGYENKTREAFCSLLNCRMPESEVCSILSISHQKYQAWLSETMDLAEGSAAD